MQQTTFVTRSRTLDIPRERAKTRANSSTKLSPPLFAGQEQRYPLARGNAPSARSDNRTRIANIWYGRGKAARVACLYAYACRGNPAPWKQLPPQLRFQGIGFLRFISLTYLLRMFILLTANTHAYSENIFYSFLRNKQNIFINMTTQYNNYNSF